MNILFLIIQFTWGSIQTFIGAIGWLLCIPFRKKTFIFENAIVTIIGKRWGGISFGAFIFLCEELDSEYYHKHEYGHCLQSLMLGPLYIIIIGIPSICWAGFGKKYREENGLTYYDFFTEKWANYLGKN